MDEANVRILGIAGSLREGSFNRALLRAAAQLVPEGAAIDVDTIEGIPLYDGDVEAASGVPARVEELKDRIAGADGLLIVTPEYNNGIPGVAKNAIDWLSRPPKDIPRVFGGKPVGLIGATTGRGGTRFAQQHWLSVLRTLGTVPFFEKSLYVADARSLFQDGELVDETVRRLLSEYVAKLAAFVGKHRTVR